MDEENIERTEPASEQRIEKARAEGQLPFSRDLMSFALLSSAYALLNLAFHELSHATTALFEGVYRAIDTRRYDIAHDYVFLKPAMMMVFFVLAKICVSIMAVTAVIGLFMTKFYFSLNGLSVKWYRLSPMQGFSRIFSLNNLVELLKSVLKLVFLGACVLGILYSHRYEWLALSRRNISQAMTSGFSLLNTVFFSCIVALAALALFDVPYQLFIYYKKLRVTHDELKREQRELEGNPEIRARIRQIQKEVARKRMMAHVPRADVVVTNPAHYAVALQYVAGSTAPTVVAKGIDYLALQIQQVAREAHVPVLESPVLARALYTHVPLDREIPSSLYTAVAQILAYVYQLKGAPATQVVPLPSIDIHVPRSMDPLDHA